MTTRLEKFGGIEPVPVEADDFIQIRETFDSLVAPTRGWVLSYKKSREHAAVKELALSPPECAPELVAALASGEFDRLAGRYLHAEHDPPTELRRRLEEILADDLNAIRLRR